MVFRSLGQTEAAPSEHPHTGINPRRGINPSSSSMLSSSAHPYQKQQQQEHQQDAHNAMTKMGQQQPHAASRPPMVTRGASEPALPRSGSNTGLRTTVSSHQRAALAKGTPASASAPRPCTPPLPCPTPTHKRQLAATGAMDTESDEDASSRRRQLRHDSRSTSSVAVVVAPTPRPSTSSGSANARGSMVATYEMRLRASSCGSKPLRKAQASKHAQDDDDADASEDEEMSAASLADSNASSSTSLNVPRFSPALASPPPPPNQVHTASTAGSTPSASSMSTTTSPRRRGRTGSSAAHHLHHHHQQHPRMHSTTPITTPLASMTSASSLDTSFNMDTEHDAADMQPRTPLEDPFSPVASPRNSLASSSAAQAPSSSMLAWSSSSSSSSSFAQAPAKALPALQRAHEGLLLRRTASASTISTSNTMALPSAEQATSTRPTLRRQATIKGGVSRPKPRASCFSPSPSSSSSPPPPPPPVPASPSLSPRQHSHLTLPTSPCSCPSTPEPKARRFSLLERRRERAMSWNETSRGKRNSTSPTFLRTGSLQLKLPVSSINAVHNDEDTRLDDMKGERVDALFDAAVAMGEDEAAKLDTSFTDDNPA